MNAAPRSSTAPDSATSAAHSMICSRLSTTDGPAITAMRWPPMRMGPTATTVSARCTSREASLYGLEIGSTCSTPSIASYSWGSVTRGPTAASTVRSPSSICRTVNPCS